MNLEKELEAQRKRVEALNYLKTQGQDIKTNNEIVKDFEKNSNRGGDNTLELLFKQKVSNLDSKRIEMTSKVALLNQQNQLHNQTNIVAATLESNESCTETATHDNLPCGWSKVLDESSKNYYYWNNVTNETQWDKPEMSTSVLQTVVSEELVDVIWIQKVHEASKQLYWFNTITGEKCFDKDKPKSSAKSSSTKSNDMAVSKSKNPVNDKKRKQYDIDPLDITGGRGDYGRQADGKMADSTAGGPLWQQRPLPNPGAILKKTSKPKTSIGPSNIFFKKS